jgi:hypothetical protein
MLELLNADQEAESHHRRMKHCVLLSHIDHRGLLSIKHPLYQKSLQDTISPSSTISMFIQSSSNLDACLETKVTEIEVVPGVIEPGVSPNIKTSSDIAEGRVRAGTKTSGPLSARVRNSGVAAERSTQTFGSEITVGVVKRHGSIKSWKTRQ